MDYFDYRTRTKITNYHIKESISNGMVSVFNCYSMKTFIVICFISVIFQVFGETLNFKQIFQTPTGRDYDKLEILERSSFGTADDQQSLSAPQPINDKTKASANAQISLRFGQEKILPCGCHQSLPPCLPPPPLPYPYAPPSPPPYCHPYPYPYPCTPILYSYTYPPAPSPTPLPLEQVLSDLSKAVSALAERAESTPPPPIDDSDKVEATTIIVDDDDTFPPEPKDECTPVILDATLPPDPKDDAAPIDFDAPLPLEPKDEPAPVIVDATLLPDSKDDAAPLDFDATLPLEPKDEPAPVILDAALPLEPKDEPAPIIFDPPPPPPLEPEDECAPVIIDATLPPPHRDDAPIVEEEAVKLTDIVQQPQPASTIKFIPITIPCPPRPEKTEIIVKEQLNNALVPHFSRGKPDLLLTYPIFNPEHYQAFEQSVTTSGSQTQYSDPRKTVIINEPTVTQHIDRVIIPLADLTAMERSVQRPLPLPFPDPAPHLPLLPKILTITRPAVWQKPVVPTVPAPRIPIPIPHLCDCPCPFCAKYTKELNE